MQNMNELKNDQVDQQADNLEAKFGEFADTYAETRAEAAVLAGLHESAEHWQEVKAKVQQGDGSDEQAPETDIV
jgi:hypothetical protein